MTPQVRIQAEDFDPAAEIAAFAEGDPGGIATFAGHVRGENGLVALELEHYPEMTLKALEEIAAEAAACWPLAGLSVIHRFGRLQPGERIVFVGAAAAHRAEAIEAMHFVIDRLKTDAPFWKREIFADGTARWVEAQSSDVEARERWAK